MNATQPATFEDRRTSRMENATEWVERRQFAESRESLNPEVRELAEAIDDYKLTHKRRYVTLAEVLDAVKRLGYHK